MLPPEARATVKDYPTHGTGFCVFYAFGWRCAARLAHAQFAVIVAVPLGRSWLDVLEQWFAALARKLVGRGRFCSLAELMQATGDYVRRGNLLHAHWC